MGEERKGDRETEENESESESESKREIKRRERVGGGIMGRFSLPFFAENNMRNSKRCKPGERCRPPQKIRGNIGNKKE
jgi:hypothetical protein